MRKWACQLNGKDYLHSVYSRIDYNPEYQEKLERVREAVRVVKARSQKVETDVPELAHLARRREMFSRGIQIVGPM